MAYEDDELWKLVIELAATAAIPVHRTFGKFVELEDLRQHACEYAIKRKSKVLEYLDRDNPDERRQGETALITMLRRHCERMARKEKARQVGYHFTDEYFYRPGMVESLIKVWASGDIDLAGQVFDPADMGQKRRTKVASEGNDLLAMLGDVGSAMDSLDPRTHGILVLRIVEGKTLAQVAEQWEITPQRVDQIVHQGIKKIIQFLGGYSPY